MKRNIKIYSIHFIKEVIPVITGILIALFINNWNETRKDKNYIEQVFSTIDSELRGTNEEIKKIIPLQNKLTDSLEFYANNNKISVFDAVRKSNGIQIPNIKINAWNAVSSSKIDLVSFEKITSLSNIEEQKLILKYKTEFLMTFLYSNFHETKKNKKETLKIILMDIIQTEQTIQKLIENFDDK